MVVILIALSCYFPDNGGKALNLPYNLIFLAWVSIVMAYSIWHHNTVYSVFWQDFILLGAVSVCLPWIFQMNNNHEVIVFLIFVLMWFLINRILIFSNIRTSLLAGVFLISLCQSIIASLQTFCPHLAMQLYEYDWLRNHGRPYGIFQQVNLLASFLASGIGCGFLLLFVVRRRLSVVGITTGLSLLTFVLVLNQSRAGAIGALLIVLCLATLLWRQHPARSAAALTLMIISAVSAWYITQHTTVLVNGVPYSLARSYGESTRERWQMLRITWHMIMLHPWAGWGYGTFEYAFSRFVLAHPEYGYTYSSIVTHPHNELLYAWFQGGVVALSGMLLLFAGWVKIVIAAWRQGRVQTGYALLIIPLLVHLNLEYPFYQSFVHFGLFILLLRLGVIDKPHSQTQRAGAGLLVAIGAAAAALLAFSLTALCAGYQLTMLERGHLANFPRPAPWYFALQGERAEFDENVSRLIDYNHTHNEADLDTFMSWAARYSLRHNDKNIWQSMILITQHRGDSAATARLRAQYNRLFPVVQTSDSP